MISTLTIKGKYQTMILLTNRPMKINAINSIKHLVEYKGYSKLFKNLKILGTLNWVQSNTFCDAIV